ncbi:MAG: SDR family oxidoreductase [Bacteroidales bacterium]|nr:SDR family oxidoreductase [Bacteroidales bacterium]
MYTLITGASGGIGHDLALLAAEDGKKLVLVARSVEKLEELAETIRKSYKSEVITIDVDLSDETGVNTLISELIKRDIQIDTLINNAGFGDFGNFAKADLPKNMELIRLNISTLTQLSHFALQGMLKEGRGKIMNVASTAAFMPGPGMAVYYASKAYVLSFTEALTRELKGTGVTVTALCPGPTDTGFASISGLGKSLMHRILPPAASMEVAKAGYKAMMKGKAIEIPGFTNKLSAMSPRFIPRGLMRNVIYGIHKNH